MDDLTFFLNVGGSVRGSGLFPLLVGETPEGAVKLEDILECHLQAVTTKGKNGVKAKLISRTSAEESRFLDDTLSVSQRVGLTGRTSSSVTGRKAARRLPSAPGLCVTS